MHRTELSEELCRHRSLFATRATVASFAGYAHGQLKRMEAFSLERMDAYERLRDRLAR